MPHEMCQPCGKIVFRSPQAAHEHKRSFRDRTSRDCLTAYPCPEVGGTWHLTCRMRMGRKGTMKRNRRRGSS